MTERVFHTVTSIEEQTEMLKFAQDAGKCFAQNPDICTYGSMERGAFLGIRHGLMERDVKVVKLDDTFVPFVFAGAAAVKSEPV